MRRIKMILAVTAAMATLLAMTAAPAMADDWEDGWWGWWNEGFAFDDGSSSELGQESESGAIDIDYGVANEGDYASQTTPALQFGNTGNFNNGSSFVQFDSVADDFEPGGIEFTIGPEQSTRSDNAVLQSSGASRR